jgi:hypothetical protein
MRLFGTLPLLARPFTLLLRDRFHPLGFFGMSQRALSVSVLLLETGRLFVKSCSS